MIFKFIIAPFKILIKLKKSRIKQQYQNDCFITDCDSGASTPCSSIGSSGHKGSLRGTKLARRARSFKDDFLEKISQMRTPTNTMTRFVHII